MLSCLDITAQIGPQIRGLFQFLPVYRNIAFYHFFLPEKNVALCYIAEGGSVNDPKHEFDIVFSSNIEDKFKLQSFKLLIDIFNQYNLRYCVKSSGSSDKYLDDLFLASGFKLDSKQIIATASFEKAKNHLSHLYAKAKYFLPIEFINYSESETEIDNLCISCFGQSMFEHQVAQNKIAQLKHEISSTAAIYNKEAIAAIGVYEVDGRCWFNPLMVKQDYRNTTVLLQLLHHVITPISDAELGWLSVSSSNYPLLKLISRWDLKVHKEFSRVEWFKL